MAHTNEIPLSNNVDRPLIPKSSHPIETGRYLLATNEIEKLYGKIQQCLNNRFPGAIIYGRPRLGKTRAIKYLTHILSIADGFYQLCSSFYHSLRSNVPLLAEWFTIIKKA